MRNRNANHAAVWTAAAIAAVIIDRVCKALVLQTGTVENPGWVAFSLFKNGGIAFSLPVTLWLYWPVAALIFAALTGLLVRACRTGDRLRAAMLLTVMLGAASNMYDRAVYGWIIDYVMFFGRGAVNIADGMIVAGLAALYWHGSRKPGPAFSEAMTGE